jgi:hypothetical protein
MLNWGFFIKIIMKPLLVGSRALNLLDPNLQINVSTDWDVISDYAIEGTEWHDPNHLNNFKLEKYTSGITIKFKGIELEVVNLWGLSIMKRSHLWRDLKFQKHITHYHKFMKGFHVPQYTPEMYADYKEREDLTLKAYERRHPNLKQSVKDFFDDAVTKKYDHDYLHELVVYYDQPLYKRLQRDPTSAWCDYGLWLELTHKERMECIAEEAHVIAIERFMVPKDWKFPTKQAYMKSIDKICTTLTSGWFRAYAIDNYPELFNMYNEEKFNNVKKVLDDNT